MRQESSWTQSWRLHRRNWFRKTTLRW